MTEQKPRPAGRAGAAIRCEHGGLRAASGKLGEGSQLPILRGGGWDEKGPRTLQERGWEEASRPAAQSTVLKPGPVSEELTPARPGRARPRKQAFPMNSTHRNRKQDTI